jgi:spore coat polysaccharide biosynthesis protein SpsF
MNIAASIQARMNSSRFPGKVLSDIFGKPMLKWQIERIQRSNLIKNIIVVTTNTTQDDEIEFFCKQNDIKCYRGSEHDVLNRVSSMLKAYKVDVHVELYGDCPLSDPGIIDEFIDYYLNNSNTFDFVSNTMETTYPPGLEVSVYHSSVLIQTEKIIKKDDLLREHVGYNITRLPEKFKLKSLKAPEWFNQPNTYLEVDTIKDLKVIKHIIKYFINKKQEHFGLMEILDMLKNNKELIKSNQNIHRRWKKFRL